MRKNVTIISTMDGYRFKDSESNAFTNSLSLSLKLLLAFPGPFVLLQRYPLFDTNKSRLF